MVERARGGSGGRYFRALGRAVVRHPWHVVAIWVVLLVATVPFLQYLGGVTTNSTTTLPANAPSSIAQAEFDRLFPNVTGASSSYLLFTGPDLTDASGQSAILNVTAALARSPSLTVVASVSSIYSAYSSYLAGQLILGAAALQAALHDTPSLPAAVNSTAALLWGVPAYFVADWQALVANGTGPSAANPEAQSEAAAHFSGNSSALSILEAFYDGAPSNGTGFNGTFDCAAQPSNVVPCAVRVVRANEPAVLPSLFPTSEGARVATTVLGSLDLRNYTSPAAQRTVATEALSGPVGLPASFLETIWTVFPSSVPDPAEAGAWANTTVAAATLASEILPVPFLLSASYVAAGGTAELVVVAFSVSDTATGPGGSTPVYSDVNAMNAIVPPVVRASDPTKSISFVQTGPAPLDQAQTTVINDSIALVLPITVAVLLVVSMLYFRSPITPLVAFAGLAIALVLGLGGTLLLGTLITHVDTTSITLEEVFVLGVGTDYAIFLISRYREERVAGVDSHEAIVTSVAWAGQSVATSGATALVATVALAFSGVALLSQWGMVLSFSIFVTILLSLTMVPALLAIIGPRVFWPYTGERFRRRSVREQARLEAKSTYFYAVARTTQRRPYLIVLICILVSIPLIYIALNVPISYDFYQQLPASQPAVAGLNTLSANFGPGFAFPTTALVTFASPLFVGNSTNATEFADLANLTSLAEATGGVAAVESLVGPYGAPLATWQHLAGEPLATQANLAGVAAELVGNDGRTVLLNIQMNSSGLSESAISTLSSIESSFSRYASTHPAVTGTAYLGGAPVTSDQASQTALATQRLFLAVALTLLIVLFVVLRSAILPVLAVATIGLSIAWAWALTYLVLGTGFGIPIFFFVPTLMFILILGFGIDYNIFLLTRVREERLRGRSSSEASAEALARTGGIITAAAIILAGAFATLTVGDFALLVAIGFSVAIAVVLDAMIVRTFLVPSALRVLGERAWWFPRRRRVPVQPPEGPAGTTAATPGTEGRGPTP